MSIKQNGGVFGRNPTFNDVTIEGQLTFDGDIDINSDLKIDGNLIVDGTSTLDGATSVTGGNFYVSNGSVSTAGVLVDANGATLSFTRNTTSYIRNNAAGGQLTFTTNGDSASTVLNLGTTGNVTVGTGNLVIGTSGKGIDFSATAGTGTSELFSDYEEGVWTPAINGTADTTYSTQYGWYTKVGNLVSVGFELTVNTEGTITGNAGISGLPFTSGASDSKSSGSLSYSASSGYSSVWQGIIVGNNQALISIYVKNAAGVSVFSLNGSDFFANGTQIIGQLTYKV